MFFREWLASGRHPQVVSISSVCNNRCLFCSNDTNPFPIESGVFREVDDLRDQLALMEAHGSPLFMSESIPGRMAEGEAFLHPRFFDILRVVRRKFATNKLCFSTNAAMLDELFLRELARYRPIEINVSMHSTRPELWAHIFGRSEETARKCIATLGLIKKHHFDLAGSIVTLPEICGWDDIERTFDAFVAHGAGEIMLWFPGYTRMTPPGTVALLRCSMEDFLGFARRMDEKHGKRIWLHPDPTMSSRVPVKRIMSLTQKGNLRNLGGSYRRVLWLTSEAAYPGLKTIVAEHAQGSSDTHRTVPVKNVTYGGNIVCAGLLMVEDFVRAGKEAIGRWPDTELVMVPGTAFDRLRMDLKGTPAWRIAEEVGRPVWLIDAERGDCDPLLDVPVFKAGGAGLKGAEAVMDTVGRALYDDDAVGKALDLVDSYPIRIPGGDAGREAYRGWLVSRRSLLAENARLLDRRFEFLDATRTLCIERWPARDHGVVTRWSFLVRRDDQWKVQSVAEGPGVER